MSTEITYPENLKHRYIPFANGKYELKPGLRLLKEGEPIFLKDSDQAFLRANKVACREEDISKYYKTCRLAPETELALLKWFAARLCKETMEGFGKSKNGLLEFKGSHPFLVTLNGKLSQPKPIYTDAIDAICSQIGEDVAVWQLEEHSDWLTAVHLCAPNHWSPAQKIGKNFDVVHQSVPGLEMLRKKYRPMLQKIAGSPASVERFAWGISQNCSLNAHPESQHFSRTGVAIPTEEYFVRVERQTLTGLPTVKAFIFTIRTFFYPIKGFSEVEKQALCQGVKSMGNETKQYKGISMSLESSLSEWCKT